MSSKRSSAVNAEQPPFDEVVRKTNITKKMEEDLEDQSGPMELQQAGHKSQSVGGLKALDEFKPIPKSNSKDFISKIPAKDSPSRFRENSNSRSGSGNARRQLIVPNHKQYIQTQPNLH